MSTLLEKKLSEFSGKKIDNQTALVDTAKLLLSSNEHEERKALSAIGLDNELVYFENKQNNIKQHKKLTEQYGVTVIENVDLHAFCLKFGLVIGFPVAFIGKLPNDIGVKVNNFVKKNEIILGNSPTYNQQTFRVVAPPELFKGHVGTYSQFFFELFKTNSEAKKLYDARKMADPILIYQLPNGFWAVIHSWGVDETIKRRIIGFMHKPKVYNFFNFIFSFIFYPMLYLIGAHILTYVLHFILPVHSHSGSSNIYNAELICVVGSIVLYLAGIIFTTIKIVSSDYSSHLYKRIKSNNIYPKIEIENQGKC